MRIVVTGATGNVGSAVVRALQADDRVEAIVGIARRLPPEPRSGLVRYVAADVRSDLRGLFAGADAVIHLAWAIQPSRDRATTASINVDGTASVIRAALGARVPSLIHASSIGTYARARDDAPVDESWPATGIATSFYSRDKAAAEHLLDRAEREQPGLRVVRLRPGLIFQRSAAAEIRRLFLGPFFPNRLLRAGRVPVVPNVRGVRFQAVHADDVAQAYRLAAMDEARGAFNLAADPVLRLPDVATLLGARTLPVPFGLARAAAGASWRLRAQPTPAGWLDIAVGVPIMDCTRARSELGWSPQQTATGGPDGTAARARRRRRRSDPAARSRGRRPAPHPRDPERRRGARSGRVAPGAVKVMRALILNASDQTGQTAADNLFARRSSPVASALAARPLHVPAG